ncbi:hypothetical protein [Nocardia callitridis]|uniref:Protein kinase G-activating protein GlnX n=1 Tax=Nocardia callitridis TaxID=648753 RepID=A0ABP9K338_9NOCA
MGARVASAAQWLRRFIATTPGMISLIALGLVVVCLAGALTTQQQMSSKIERADTALTDTEPLAFAAQRLYVALSVADATAATAFLSGGIEAPEVRAQYQQSLADAAAALSDTTIGASDALTRHSVARIAADLPAYTGLVEAARANNRQGFPVGSSYLREASDLMRNSLLPTAEGLTSSRFAAVRADEHTIGTPPWSSVLVLLLVLLGCAAASVLLLRQTNRRLNVGVAAAATFAALALVWAVAATAIASTRVDTGAAGASSRFETLAKARISAQQARADETLQLVTRGDVEEGEQLFTQHEAQLRAQIDAALPAGSDAGAQLGEWGKGHVVQVEAYRSADYPAAVKQAIGNTPESSATRFALLDRSLNDSLADARNELRDGLDSARTTLTFSPSATLVLLVLGAAAAATGLWPRLKEFL